VIALLSDQLLKVKAWHAAISTHLPIITAPELLWTVIAITVRHGFFKSKKHKYILWSNWWE
jgi:hypothetical protein